VSARPLSWLAGCLGGLLAAQSVGAAAPFQDPFLEQFRVGAYADAERIALDDGWPRDLFAPLVVDTLWQRAATEYFAPASLRQEHGLLLWRILAPALGSATAQAAWYERRNGELAVLLGKTTRPSQPGPETSPAFPFLAYLLKQSAMTAYRDGAYGTALEVVRRLLARTEDLGLPPEEVFVWSLRRRWLQAKSSGSPPAPEEPWPELLDLGPFDAQSGWAVWRARRRARGEPPLPAGCGTAELGRWLAGVADPGLTAAELREAGFPPDVLAGLGAAVLPRGAELDAHLAAFPRPPAARFWQEQWANGVRRQGHYQAGVSEALARRTDLEAGLRVDLWRRAAEARLLKQEWDAGLADLGQALRLVPQVQDSGLAAVLRRWTLQALVLAHARGLESRERAVRALAADLLAGKNAEVFQRELVDYGLMPAPDAEPPQTRRQEALLRVRSGEVSPLRWQEDTELGGTASRARARLWDLWLRWGLGLAPGAGTADSGGARCRDYRDGLRAAGRADTPQARFALGCAAIGRFLRGSELREPLAAWLLERDLVHSGPPGLRAGPSPLPGLRRMVPGRAPQDRLARHALLGAALAAGDLRGQLAMAVSLPQGSLPLDDRLRFLYPVPAEGELLEALGGCGLEPSLVLAIARNESLFDPAARSRAGALGWLQIMPFHWPGRGYGGGSISWNDPVASLDLGVRLLREGKARFAGDPYRAVAAYNAGSGAVARWENQLGGPQPASLFLIWIGYPETQRYVEKVLRDREIYDWIIADQEP
jgi:hypothetical protein